MPLASRSKSYKSGFLLVFLWHAVAPSLPLFVVFMLFSVFPVSFCVFIFNLLSFSCLLYFTLKVITEYDHDQLYPAYGFGGRQPNAPVSHCFALNGNPSNPAVRGVDGILESCAYLYAEDIFFFLT